MPAHIPGRTWHGRRGGPENAFAYGVDYVLLDPDAPGTLPGIFGLNLSHLPLASQQPEGIVYLGLQPLLRAGAAHARFETGPAGDRCHEKPRMSASVFLQRG